VSPVPALLSTSPRLRLLLLGWLPPLAWACFLFAGSSSSDPSLGWLAGLFPGADKVIHFGLYAVLGALLCRAVLLGGRPARRSTAIALAAGLGALYGASDELHQLFVTGRSAELLDLLADGLGSLSGSVAWAFFEGLLRARRATQDALPSASG